MLKRIRTILLLAGLAVVTGSARAGLVASANGLGVYDTVNNVTWTADANLMASQAASYVGGPAAYVDAVIAASGGVIHDTPNPLDTVANSGIYRLSANDFFTNRGYVTWWGAQAWVNYLNVTRYGGSQQWALPTTVDSPSSYGFPDGVGNDPAQSSSQLATLFYGGLGQVAGTDIATNHNGAYGLFSNVQNSAYWSGTEYAATPEVVWAYGTAGGYHAGRDKTNGYYVLAVTPGQLSAVPIPGTAWLLGSALLGLAGISRRRLFGCGMAD